MRARISKLHVVMIAFEILALAICMTIVWLVLMGE